MTDQQDRRQELARRFAEADGLACPLDGRLEAYAAGSREIIPEILAVYDRFVARLAQSSTISEAPKPGDAMPDFVLPDQDGRLVGLAELLATGPAVISLNRGHWCPYCRLELRALARATPHLAERGAQVASIVPETGSFAARLVAEQGLPFRVLSDIDLGYTLGLGLVVWIGEEMIATYQEYGIELPRFQGNAAWFLPIPATYVVGRDRIIKAGFVNPDFRRRMTIEQIEAALAA